MCVCVCVCVCVWVWVCVCVWMCVFRLLVRPVSAHRSPDSLPTLPRSIFFKLIYYTDSRYNVYKDKLQNCSCNQFHSIGTCNQVETNSMTNNRGGNKGSEK